MVTPHKILSGVPMPEITRQPRTRLFQLEAMERGDCILIPRRTVRSLSAYVSRLAKGRSETYECRPAWMVADGKSWKLSDEGAPDAISGAGVWRTV